MLDAFGVLGKNGALLANDFGFGFLDLDLGNFSFANFSVFFFPAFFTLWTEEL